MFFINGNDSKWRHEVIHKNCTQSLDVLQTAEVYKQVLAPDDEITRWQQRRGQWPKSVDARGFVEAIDGIDARGIVEVIDGRRDKVPGWN